MKESTTHVIFEPLDFIARLAALTPPPRVNLTRFHGVFAPNSPYRPLIVPKKVAKDSDGKAKNDEDKLKTNLRGEPK